MGKGHTRFVIKAFIFNWKNEQRSISFIVITLITFVSIPKVIAYNDDYNISVGSVLIDRKLINKFANYGPPDPNRNHKLIIN